MMALDDGHIPTRQKLILAGQFLSKFDVDGLAALGFDGFVEAYNVIGLALGGSPASIKNYRDEFDPLFPNPRKGWHRRALRGSSAKVLEQYRSLDIRAFSLLIRSFFEADSLVEAVVPPEAGVELDNGDTPFARRLITGIAAERYFENVFSELPEFSGYRCENTTRLGCGYDFRLRDDLESSFIAVEVKGVRDRSGSVALTQKEHRVAELLLDRFCLFVVKNFREIPCHEIYRNPLKTLSLARMERTIVQVSWVGGV